MIFTILTMILSIMGMVLVFLAVAYPTKMLGKMPTADKAMTERYIHSQRVLHITVGLFYLFLGALLGFRMIPGEYTLFYMVPVIVFEKLYQLHSRRKFQDQT